jgi:hypothetical protein
VICGGDVVDGVILFYFIFYFCYGKSGQINVIEGICVMINGRWKGKKMVLLVWMWLTRW